MFTTRLRAISVFVVLAAAGSGLLLAQSPQAVGTWVGVGTADNPFGNGASVALSDGRTLIVGGAGPDGAATNVVSSFDTATNQFAIAGTLLNARTGHTATLLNNGRVLVTGGTVNSLGSTEIEIFDPSTGASTLVAQMPEPRRGHVAALLQNGRVLIAGGYTTGDVVLQSAFIFDPATNAVSPTPGGLNVARASASATSLIDGRVVIVGGTDGTNDLRSAEIYDPFLQSFTTASTQLSVPVHGHSAVLLPHNGSVLVAGGTSNGVAQAGAHLFLPAEFPDPFSWGIGQFAPTNAMNAARSSAIAGPTAYDGYAVVTGGGSSNVERYRFATIKTDQDDYTPGETALITGTGWQPGEQVTLRFQEDPAVHEDYELTVTANGQGNISHDQWAPEQHDLGVRFYLMAVGSQSGRRAQTTFTDANNFDVSPLTQSVTAGSTNNFVWTLTATNNANDTTTTFTIPAAWPAPLTAAGPNQVTVTGCTSGFTIGGAGNRVISITQSGLGGRCSGGDTLVVSYLNVVAPTPVTAPQTYTFAIDDASPDPTVTVTAPANTAPVITESDPIPVTMSEDGSPTPFSLTLNATDAQNNTLTWSISTAALHGTASATGTGNSKAIGYTPASNYNGSDSFVVQVSDGNGGTDTITVNVAIAAVNDQPSFTAANPAAVNEDSSAQIVSSWASFQAGGGTDESSQTATYVVSNVGNTALFSSGPVVSANGTLTYTPAPNAHGTSTFDVFVQDSGGTPGVDTSATQQFIITVNDVNDAPSFTGGGDVTSNEDSAYSATWATAISAGPNESGQALTFSVTANTNTGLFSVQPSIASGGTLTFTPAANAFGTASVTVRLSDNGGTTNGGSDMSAPVTFTITVNSSNDAPSFTSGGGVTVNEDSGAYSAAWATAISAGPANESGETLTFSASNDNTALFSVQPAIAANGMLSFTPAANAFGAAVVTVSLSDNGGTANGGVDTSPSQTFTITVTGVNDAPSFTSGGDVSVNEDSGAYSASWAAAVNAGPNESGQALTFNVSNNNNALFSSQPAIAANGTLTFNLAADAFGTATVTVSLSDDGGTANGGINTSSSQTFTITVNSSNDAPSFTSGGTVTVNEDSGAYSAAWATAISAGPPNESGQTVTFNVTSNTNTALFSVQPSIAANGALTFTPAEDAFGSADVTITLSDNGGVANGGVDTSAAQTFTITVTGVNDAPSFTSGGTVTVNEDSAAYSATWATAVSAGPNESGQALTFSVTANTNTALFSVQPAIAANGTLTFTLAANAFGAADVTVTLKDDGGTALGGVDTSAPQTFTITVNAVNDAPSFTSGGAVTVNEDSAAYSAGWATAISAGPANESGQTLTFAVTNDNNALFSGQPAIAADGTLTFTLAANAFGAAQVTVTLSDNGGTAYGGVDTSPSQQFTITVTAVNDAPSFTSGGAVTVNEDSAAYSAAWATAISPGPNESGQTLTFTVTNDNNALFSGQPAIAANGTLTFTLAADAFGAATVTVTLKDDGGTALGGVDTSPSQTFTITVNAVNDAPTFTASALSPVNEDAPAQTITGWVTSFNPGGGTFESGQSVLAYHVSSVTPGIFSAGPSVSTNGTLTYTLAPNANGTASFTVRVQDNGGTANVGVDLSAPQTFTLTINAVNDEPSFTGSNQTVVEDAGPQSVPSWATFNAGGGADEATQTAAYTVSNVSSAALFLVQPTVAPNGTLTYTTAANAFGSSTFQVTVQDSGGTLNGGDDTSVTLTYTITVTAVNDAPANLSLNVTPKLPDGSTSILEGNSVSLSGSFTDVETETHTVVINWGDGTPNASFTLAAGTLTIPATSHQYVDDNPTNTASDVYTITVTVTDSGSTQTPPNPLPVSTTTGVTVNNVTPTLALTSPLDGALYALGTAVSLTAPITDPGADNFTCKINWDDPANPALDTFTQAAKNCNRSRTFTQPGVYTIVITVNDDDQPGVTDTKSVMVIVYDPSSGFVTGGGTIWSQLGAYVPNPALEGKANFGFVSKYQKGAKTPTGQTEFQFHAGDLNFHGDVYQWLVVSGAKAQYKGTGDLNGVPGYGFLLTATDGQLSGGGGVDKFRIKITTSGGVVVYDNNPGPDDIDTSGQQNIQTGSIVIHSK